MEAKPIPVKDLLGKHFNIPYYQRGYRWEEKQVNDLLNDLQEFYFKTLDDNYKDVSFYCMQTLVVSKNQTLSEGNNPVYDVIDGQQRLTTIYLLLLYITSKSQEFKDPLYTLKYERMDDTISQGLFNVDNLKDLTANSKQYLADYNDFIFLFKAYQTIKNWFGETGHIYPSKMQEILIGDNTGRPNQKDVRFLWYEPDQEIDNESEANVLRGSIDIFNRLNYGQTPLTSTDLIKAMLMICDIYPKDSRRLQEAQSSRYASEWDLMEKRLHNRLLWAMLVPNGFNPTSRMELLFDYVAHDMYENKKDWEEEAYKKIKLEDNDFSYRVISAYLLYCKTGIVDSEDYKQRVETVWHKVQSIYHMFCNWYQNRKTYHLIGLYLLLHENSLGKKTYIQPQYHLYKKLIKEYKNNSRNDFIDKLKELIGLCVKITTKFRDENKVEKLYTLESINYGQTPKDLIRVLLLFNVHETMNEIAENPLFDFALFKSTNPTSLEHIHPQNLKLDDKQIEEWYASRREVLSNKNKIPDPTTTNEEELKLLNAISFLDMNLSQRSDDTIKKKCEMSLRIIDKHFDELAKIGEDEMHTIKNMALVDGPVNSAFSNRLLNDKRQIMYEKAAEHTDGHPDHYIMIATRRVFNKMYTPMEDIHDMEFWGRKDRAAYFERIKEVYNIYVK